MSTLELLREQLLQTWHDLLTSIVDSLPVVLVGIALVLLALLIARLVRWGTRVALERVHFDRAIERLGLDRSLRQFGITKPLSQLIPTAVYWLLLFLFARTFADNLGLTPVSEALGTSLSYVPNIIAAIAVLLAGSLMAQFAGSGVAQASESAGLEFGPALGRLVSALILFVAIIMAISQLRIDTDIVRIVTACSLAGVALAFALSFGLGMRSTVEQILAGFYVRKVLDVGDRVEVHGETAELQAITPTLAVLERDGKRWLVPNSALSKPGSPPES